MKVILAGYSKTGTKSMAAAFNILGYRNYDVVENFVYLGDEWKKIFTQGGTADDFRRMYEGVDSVTDTPVFYFWEQLHEAFPDAKIILTLRDETLWYASILKQFEQINNSYFIWVLFTLTVRGIRERRLRYHMSKFMGDVASWPSSKMHPHSELVLKRMYREHNNYVLAKAPKDQLLVYRVSEGWEPLCKFLGVDVPDQPFPHKNKKGALVEELRKTNKLVLSYVGEVAVSCGVIFLFAGVYGYKLFQSWPFLQEVFLYRFESVTNWFYS